MKKLAKRSVAFALAVVMAISLLTVGGSAATATVKFTDIAGNPYASAIEALAEAGIIEGVGGGKFAPGQAVTRAMAITVLGRMAEVQQKDTDKFTDVVNGSWYSGYVGWAEENGIVVGDGNGHYMPNQNITGEGMELILTRFAKVAGIDYTATNTSTATLTRGELAQMVYNVYVMTNCTVNLDYPDKNFGPLPATFTVDIAAETYTLIYDTPYEHKVITGWYIPNGDEMIVGVLSGVDNMFITDADVIEGVTPEILKFYQERGLSTVRREYDPATCEHRWLNGVCAACGTKCEHPSWSGTACSVCGTICTHTDHDKDTLICKTCGQLGYHTFVNGVCTGCGAITNFAMESSDIADLLANEAKQQGTIEDVEYTTYKYNSDGTKGEAVTTKALVYLPAGYDSSKQYNILYLMHGGGDTEQSWFRGAESSDTPNLLDNMIASGYCDPLIVVTPTTKVNGTNNFGYEFMNDLIPYIETNYATYAKGDDSAANLKTTRDHRAYAGLSMGSITSWFSILMLSTDYVSYVGSYSGGPTADVNEAKGLADEVMTALKASGNEIKYWFNGNGVRDMAHDPHVIAYHYVMETYPELFADGVNSCWVDYVEGMHGWVWWQLDLYNSLSVFFKDQNTNLVKGTQTAVIEGFDWGPSVTKTVIELDKAVTAGSISAKNFLVSESRQFMNWAIFAPDIATTSRKVTAAYTSDAKGNKVDSASKYITLELAFDPVNSGNPYFYDAFGTGFNDLDDNYALHVRLAKDSTLTTENGVKVDGLSVGNVDLSASIRPQLDIEGLDLSGKFTGTDGKTLTYASYTPAGSGKHPLVIWLHGMGEGGTDPSVALLGNMVTALLGDEFQNIMGGAYVLVPQVNGFWLQYDENDLSLWQGNPGVPSIYTKSLMELIQKYVAENPNIDTDRIIIGGCSNGGYMTMNMVIEYPGYFAAAYPICECYKDSGITEEKLQSLKDLPIWFIYSKDDNTVDPSTNEAPTIARLKDIGGDVHTSIYEHVYDTTGLYKDANGNPYLYFGGHSSWQYFFNNYCVDDTTGVNMWQWMSEQSK